jgi:hypothetical protein
MDNQRLRRKFSISPPWQRPHGVWYVCGPAGCGAAATFWQAYLRYITIPSRWTPPELLEAS